MGLRSCPSGWSQELSYGAQTVLPLSPSPQSSSHPSGCSMCDGLVHSRCSADADFFAWETVYSATCRPSKSGLHQALSWAKVMQEARGDAGMKAQPQVRDSLDLEGAGTLELGLAG